MSDVCHLVGFVPYDPEKLFESEQKKKIYGNGQEKEPINCPNIVQNLHALEYSNCVERLSAQSWNTLFQFEEENYRRGYE